MKNNKNKSSMIERKSWNEFRNTGLSWFINTILHTFGWAITFNVDDSGNVIEAFPSRVKFRGFSERINSEGYTKVSHYLQDNMDALVQESECEIQ